MHFAQFLDHNIFHASPELRLPGLALAALQDFFEQLAEILRTQITLLGNCRELLRRLPVQTVAAAEDLIIRILTGVAGQAFVDSLQKLGGNGFKVSILELLDLGCLKPELMQESTQ